MAELPSCPWLAFSKMLNSGESDGEMAIFYSKLLVYQMAKSFFLIIPEGLEAGRFF